MQINKNTTEFQELLQKARIFFSRAYWPEQKKEEELVFYQLGTVSPKDLELEPSFSETLFSLIKEKGISETDCYKNAYIDRRLFSKIRSQKDYHPKKKTVLALALSLKLTLSETKDFLETAGYSLSHSIKEDVLVVFCISKKIYEISLVDEILEEFGCELFNTEK